MSFPSSGDVIGGKYRVGAVIAEGGMGVIVEGVHVQLEDTVAIKFLKPSVAGPEESEVVKRFMREARTCKKIRSEHVVRVLDVDNLASGVPYMVMERLSGRDLDAIVETSGPLPITAAVDYVLQALEAIAEAHALGIVHRDLKPANLFLAERADGSPCIKVLDFGISKVETGTDGGITQTQAVMGSPRYMSPEQLRASRGVDARTDIWSLGVVLYELVTGRPPFDGQSMTQITAAILEEVPAPLALPSEPNAAAFEAVVVRCLKKRPEDRFADVGELASALAPFGSPAAAVSATRVQNVLSRALHGSPPLSQSRPSITSTPDVVAGARTEVSWGVPPSTSGSHRRLGIAVAAALVLSVAFVALVLHRKAPASESDRSEPAALAPSALGAATSDPPPAASAESLAPPAPKASGAPAVTASVEPKASAPTTSVRAVPPAPRKAAVAVSAARPPASAAPVSTTWSDRK
jgi:serine/threonine-protein kinase